MGTVFRARETASEREVAIKLLATPAGATAMENRTRFEREKRVMKQVSHDNVVAVIDDGSVDGRDFLVLEYIEGCSLREALTESGMPTPARALAILDGIAAALGCLHAQSIVHRDLKPGNILVDRDGRVKLTDFGISSPVAELGDITATNQFVGSLDYMAPEQRTRLPIDERADQYALAVIAYELLTGKRPVGTFRPPSTVNKRLSPAVDPVIARALEEDPDDRYASVVQFVEALRGGLAKTSRRQRVMLLVGMQAVIVVAVILGWDSFAAMFGSTTPVSTNRLTDQPTARPFVPWVEMADQRLAEGNLEGATKALDEAIRLDAENADLFHRRALVHKRNEMFQLSLNDLASARALDPTLADAWVGAASIHVNLKNYEEAIAVLDEAIAQDALMATAFAWRGWAHHGMQRDDLALADLEHAIELDRDCGIAYQWRGSLEKARKDWPAVGRDYAEFARCHPEDPNAHRLLASFLALCNDNSLRDGKRAVYHATRACELTQWQSWAALRMLAYAQTEAGDLEAAIASCKQAYELAPENQKRTLLGQRRRYEALLPKK